MTLSSTKITYMNHKKEQIKVYKIIFNEIRSFPYIEIESLNTKQVEKLEGIKFLNLCKVFVCKNIKRLSKLPDLPNCEIFVCQNCSIEILPSLPKCKSIICSNNKIEHFLDSSINADIFNCDNNNITKLPLLLNCKYLNCSNNNIRVLPALPLCRGLICNNNRIKYLPLLNNVQKLEVKDNPTLYYNNTFCIRFKIPVSPFEIIVRDFWNIKTFLTNLSNNFEKEDNKISLLFEKYYDNDKDFFHDIFLIIKLADIDDVFYKHIKYLIRYHNPFGKI